MFVHWNLALIVIMVLSFTIKSNFLLGLKTLIVSEELPKEEANCLI